MILIGIEGQIYDVTRYIHRHPGEGICGRYLRNFNRSQADTEFDRFHGDEPYDMLEEAQQPDSTSVCPITWVSPWIFGRRIPKYFTYFRTVKEKYQRLENLVSNEYLLYPNLNESGYSLVVVTDSMTIVRKLNLYDKQWTINGTDITAPTIEKLVKICVAETLSHDAQGTIPRADAVSHPLGR